MVDDSGENKTQAQRFIDAAKIAESDQSDDALDRIMGRLDLKKKPEPEKSPIDE